MFEAIESTDWAAIPGYAKFYNPTVIAAALRRVADAASSTQAADAASPLFDGGLVHAHSAGAQPAAVTAAPILLEIAEHSTPARPLALGLLEDAMRYHPYEGYTSVATVDGPDIPVCCAIARAIHPRRDLLTTLGRTGKELLAEAHRHWRFTINEASAGTEPDSTLALGTLEGLPANPPEPCDMRHPNRSAVRLIATAELAWPADAPSAETFLLLRGISPDHLPPRTTLWSPCTDRVH